MSSRPDLETLVQKFKENRQTFNPLRPSLDEIEKLRDRFTTDFSKDKISKLTLEEYAEGLIDPNTKEKRTDSFSYRIANKMPYFGSIENPSGMYTFEIFFRKETQKPDYKQSKYSSAEEAFSTTKKLILDLLEAGASYQIDSIEKNTLHSFLKSKILCIYYPEKFLNIHSKPACVQLVRDLGILTESELEGKSMFALQQELIKFKEKILYLKNINNFDYGHLLWLYYDGGIPSEKKNQRLLSVYLDDLAVHDVPKTHIQVLKKFFSSRGNYLSATQIYGKWFKGEKWEKTPLEPDDLVDAPHFLHSLVKGVYKPKDDRFAQSIQLNPTSKWELELDRNHPTLRINYDFGSFDEYKDQIEGLKTCYEHDVPIGILFRTAKGRYKSLGLGKIISHTENKFIIESYGISETESAKLKDETIEEFDETLTDPDFAKLDEINFTELFSNTDFVKQQLKLKQLKESPPTRARISQIIGNCENGEWVVPVFQRYFDWKKDDIRDFLKSIFLDYYVGSLLLWDIRKESQLDVEAIKGVANKDLKKNSIILDGQQRVTSLYYAIKSPNFPLKGSSKKSFFYVDFAEFLKDEPEELIRVFAEQLDRVDCYKKLLFPFYELENYRDWLYGLEDHLRAQNLDAQKVRSIFEIIDRKLHHVWDGVEIPYVILSDERKIDQVTDIFEKINSTGIQLSVFDLLIARLSKYNVKLKDLWDEASQTEKISKYYANGKGINKIPIYILESIALSYTGSGSCKRKDVLDIYVNSKSSKETFEKRWNEMTQYTNEALELLENTRDGFGVVSQDVLPFEPMIPVLASLLKEMNTKFRDLANKCFSKITNWYWVSVFSNAYSSAVDSQKTSDYKDMVKWFAADEEIPRGIAKFRVTFDSIDLRNVEQKSNAMYRGVLGLVALAGGNDFDKNRSVINKKYQQDHIFPKSKFDDNEYVNSILNITWLTKDTNERIKRAKIPSEFIKQTIQEKYDGNESSFLETLQTHLITKTAFECMKSDDFDGFLTERLGSILGLIGKKIGADPDKKIQTAMITSEQPYTSKRRLFRTVLSSCKDYVWWVDKYFRKKGFEFLIDLRDENKINEIKILLALESVEKSLKDEFVDFSEEMNNYGKTIEMRVIADSKTKQSFHDRWIISKNVCYNVPSIDVAMRTQIAEFKATENRPPFEEWWNNSLDIIKDWDKINNMLNRKN